MALPEAITRKEMYYAYLMGTGTNYPNPITREEQYLYYLCENGGIGESGTVTSEQIESAINKYIEKNGFTIDAYTKAEMDSMIATDDEVNEMLNEVFASQQTSE